MDKQKEANKDIVVGTIEFKFSLTSDEANEVVNNPRGECARKLKHYLNSILKEVAKKTLQKLNETVDK